MENRSISIERAEEYLIYDLSNYVAIWINYAFTWRYTPESDDFWQDIHLKWRTFVRSGIKSPKAFLGNLYKDPNEILISIY